MFIRQSAALWLFVSLLALGACSKKDKVSDGPILVSETWIKDQVSRNLLDNDVYSASAQEAIDYIGSETGENISWEKMSGSRGDYTFENLTLEEGSGTIDRVEVTGLRMIGDELPFADSLVISGLKLTDPDDSPLLTVDTINLALPAADQFILAIDMDPGANKQDFEAFRSRFSSGELNFYLGGGYLEGLTIKSDEVYGKIDFIGWAEEQDERKLSFLMNNADFNMENFEPDSPENFSLESFSVRAFDLEFLDNAASRGAAGFMQSYMAWVDPFDPKFKSIILKNANLSGDGMTIDMPSLKTWYSKMGQNKLVANVEMATTKITFDETVADPEIEGLRKLGYEDLGFSLTGRTILDKAADLIELENAMIRMDDGFDLTYDYRIAGVGAVINAVELASKDIDFNNPNSVENPFDMDPVIRSLDHLKLFKFNTTFTDRSIINRSFEMQAKDQDVSPDLIRQQVKGAVMMATIGAKSDYQSELAMDFAENVQKLIDEGGALRFSMTPEDGFNLGKVAADYQAFQKAQMEALIGPSDDQAVEISPKTFDVDAVLKSLGIDFEHLPK